MEKLRNLFVRGAVFGTIFVMVSSCEPKEERLMPGMKAYGENPTFTLWMSSVDDSHAAADTADFTDHVIGSVPTQQNDTVPCDCDTVVEPKKPCDCDTVVEPKKPCDCDTVAEQRCCPTINNNNGVLIVGNNNTVNQNQTTVNTNGNNNQTTVNTTSGNGNRSNVRPQQTQPIQQRRTTNQNRRNQNQQQTQQCQCQPVVEESHTHLHIRVRGSMTVTQKSPQGTTYYHDAWNYSR